MRSTDTPPTLRIQRLALTVRDLDRVARFYREDVGLHLMERDSNGARLGSGSSVLLDLRHDAGARLSSPREAGLFHAAFLLPSRADLARFVAHAVRARLPIDGVADHRVSEAVYLTDPEGNGVEIACDRPRATWPRIDGALAMATDPLDVEALLREAGSNTWAGAPDGTAVGHVHLRVGAIAPAEAFYAGVLGMPLTARYPGGSFFAADGYHHHVAANIWGSHGAGQRGVGTAGLAEVTIRFTEAQSVETIARRAAAAGVAASWRGAALILRDPWDLPFVLTKADQD